MKLVNDFIERPPQNEDEALARAYQDGEGFKLKVEIEGGHVLLCAESPQRLKTMALALWNALLEDEELTPKKDLTVPQLCAAGIKARRRDTFKSLKKAVKEARREPASPAGWVGRVAVKARAPHPLHQYPCPLPHGSTSFPSSTSSA